MSLQIRAYGLADAAITLKIFRTAVLIGAAKDYTPVQLTAWAGTEGDYPDWHTMRCACQTVVAVHGGKVVGFTDISLKSPGYLNMLFVDPAHQRLGVGGTLIEWAIGAAQRANMETLSTHASRTARPVFAAHGFHLVKECAPMIRGVQLTNYEMIIKLPSC